MRPVGAGVALALLLVQGRAQAHDAFGDLGPFYGGLLHPLIDPAQGLMLVALALLLARQPRQSVRVAYLMLVACAALAVVLHLVWPMPEIGTQLVGGIVAVLGLLALAGPALPVSVTALLAAALALPAGWITDVPDGPREALLSAGGGVLGIALVVLFAWCLLDLLQARWGRIVGTVAGSWVAAIGVMATALPAVAE